MGMIPIRGTTLFMRVDLVEAAWSLLMPVLDVWAKSPPDGFPNCAAGTWGPEAAEGLIPRDGRNWALPTLLPEAPNGWKVTCAEAVPWRCHRSSTGPCRGPTPGSPGPRRRVPPEEGGGHMTNR